MGRKRILIADDNAEMRQRVEDLLRGEFEVVGSAADGQQALDTALRLNPDVLVTDISMPLIDGMQLTDCLRNSSCNTRVIFLTVHEDKDYVDATFAIGAFGYVIKARLNEDLILAVEAACENRKFVSPFPATHI